MEAIFNRRSVRRFKEEPISDDQLHILLKAAMAAPNAFESNEWEFIVVQSAAGKKQIAATSHHAKPALHAAAVIIVCGNKNMERFTEVMVQNCCAAIENILICAADMDLGSLWLGIGPDTSTKLRQAFQIPNYVLPIGMVAVGTAAENLPPHDRYFAEKVHFEQY